MDLVQVLIMKICFDHVEYIFSFHISGKFDNLEYYLVPSCFYLLWSYVLPIWLGISAAWILLVSFYGFTWCSGLLGRGNTLKFAKIWFSASFLTYKLVLSSYDMFQQSAHSWKHWYLAGIFSTWTSAWENQQSCKCPIHWGSLHLPFSVFSHFHIEKSFKSLCITL